MSDAPSGPDVPVAVRLHFGRAAVQTIANSFGFDLLHVKGDAVDPALRSPDLIGSDIDILARPSQITEVDSAVRQHGWKLYSTFEHGSPFGHAQTYHHPEWGFLDLHRRFPGIGEHPDIAFEHLWRVREELVFGTVMCPVPDVTHQAVILLLNAARARGADDVQCAWHDASDISRRRIEQEVEALDARIAFDAALGDLERHRRAREYRLWRAVSEDRGRMEEWWGRFLAAPSSGARLRIVARAPLVNAEHLAIELGRAPTRGEIVREFVARPIRGIRELARHGSR